MARGQLQARPFGSTFLPFHLGKTWGWLLAQRAVHGLVSSDEDKLFISRCLSERGLSGFFYEDVWEFLQNFSSGSVDCLILDINLPGLNGLELLQRARRAGHRLPGVVMIGPDDLALAVRAMKAGASDYLPRPLGRTNLINLVQECLERGGQSVDRPAFLDQLSSRESEVLRVLATGRSAAEAAEFLGVKTETVNFHTANMRRKAGTNSTRDLVTQAVAGGFVV